MGETDVSIDARDDFAISALNALIAGRVLKPMASIRDHADLAYAYADAMLAARERKPE